MNIATMFTFSRILCAPYVAFLIVEYRFLEALIWLAFAVMTDVLDGAIARAFAQQTEIGSWLDPLADKLLMLGVFCSLWYSVENLIPTWFILCMLIKEGALVCAACAIKLAHRPMIITASVYGKLAMFLQVSVALYCVFQYVLFGAAHLAHWMLCCTLAVAFVALCDYGIRVVRHWRVRKQGGL